MKQNGIIYVRLRNNLEETDSSATAELTWIDKLPPQNFVPTAVSSDNTITLTGSTTDQEETSENASSGISKYYFSKDNGETWFPEVGQSETSYTFQGLNMGSTYNLKMKAVDKAGNEIVTETIEKKVIKPVW